MSTNGNILRSARSGIQKAERDIRKAERFLAENPSRLGISDPFWQTLGYDISVDADQVEAAAWNEAYSTWKKAWEDAHPLEVAQAQMESNARALEKVVGNFEGQPVTIGMIVGPEGETLIDKMNTAHEHPGEDCPATAIFRSIRIQYAEHVTTYHEKKD